MWALTEGNAISTRIKYSDSERLKRELDEFYRKGGKCTSLDKKPKTKRKYTTRRVDEKRLARMNYQKSVLEKFYIKFPPITGAGSHMSTWNLLVRESGTKLKKTYIGDVRLGKSQIVSDVEWKKIEDTVYRLIGELNEQV